MNTGTASAVLSRCSVEVIATLAVSALLYLLGRRDGARKHLDAPRIQRRFDAHDFARQALLAHEMRPFERSSDPDAVIKNQALGGRVSAAKNIGRAIDLGLQEQRAHLRPEVLKTMELLKTKCDEAAGQHKTYDERRRTKNNGYRVVADNEVYELYVRCADTLDEIRSLRATLMRLLDREIAPMDSTWSLKRLLPARR